MRIPWLVWAWVSIAAVRAAAVEIRYFEYPTSWVDHGSEEPAWSHDGAFLAYTGTVGPDPTRIVATTVRAASLEGEPLPWLDVVREHGSASPTWSPDGSRIAFSYEPAAHFPPPSPVARGIWIASQSGESPTLVSPYFRPWMRLAWSPTADTIAIASRDTLWLLSTVDGSMRTLRTDGNGDNAPAWAPDGRALAFSSLRSGNPDLWILEVGSGALRRLTEDPADDCSPTWSPDGRWIAFSSNRGGSFDVWAVRAAGGEAIQLTDDPGWDGSPAWSPGGRIAFVSSRRAPDPEAWHLNIWIASQLPDIITTVEPRSWTEIKRSYR